ncbi:MAG: hypothetical protein K5924_06430 [Chloroflexi bacterium]|nr:hypothetical protein [Chloroflexota bacterium]
MTLHIASHDERVRSVVLEQLDPFRGAEPPEGAPADVVIEDLDPAAVRVSEMQRLAGDGFETVSDGTSLYAVTGDTLCRLPDAAGDGPLRFAVGPGFPLRPMFRSMVRPTLQARMLDRGALAIHGACVHHGDGAVLVTGWSESGKTETALALLERGATFVSDKWTVVEPGARAGTFPVGVGIRRWMLPYAPKLANHLPRAARMQLTGAGVAGAVSSPVRRMQPRGRLGRLLVGTVDRAVQLADRVALTPTDLATIYGSPGDPDATWPIRGVVILRTVPGDEVSAGTVDVSAIARRLAWSAMVERAEFHAYRHRAAYALAWGEDDLARRMFDIESSRIGALLAEVPSVEVAAPFPMDPGRIVDAALTRL